jgi:hypothetical protein
VIDRDFSAIALDYRPALGMFGAVEITRVNVTPPAAFEFVCALESGREMGCINCSSCGYPHLDLGDFAKKPHRKHFCANCGRDSTWSRTEMVSKPLKPLHDSFMKAAGFAVPERSINIDEHPGANYGSGHRRPRFSGPRRVRRKSAFTSTSMRGQSASWMTRTAKSS